jgi:hypothetical protein
MGQVLEAPTGIAGSRRVQLQATDLTRNRSVT